MPFTITNFMPFIVGIFAVILIIFAISMAGSGEKPEKVSQNNSVSIPSRPAQSSAQSSKTTELKEKYKVGDVVKIGDYTFSVNSFEDNAASGNEYLKPKEGNKFVKINLTIENNGKEKTAISTMLQMYLKDSEGTRFKQTFLMDQKQIDGELLAGDKIKGDVAYEVPKNSTGLKFYYNAAWLLDESIVIEL